MDDLEGLEMTLEILGDSDIAARISESLAALGVASPALTCRRFARIWPGAALPARDGRTWAAVRDPVPACCTTSDRPQRLPEAVAAAVLEFCEAASAGDPQRVGKPLFGPLAGCHGARRGTFASFTGSMTTAALSTSSTSTTAPRSTIGANVTVVTEWERP